MPEPRGRRQRETIQEIQDIQSDICSNVRANDKRKCQNQEDNAKEKKYKKYKTFKKYKKYKKYKIR